jgi:hypothetical protein
MQSYCFRFLIPTKPSWGVKGGRPARKANNLTAICEPIV